MEKMLANIEKELKEIEEQGLSTNNIEIACKLLEMKKNIKLDGGDEMRGYRGYGGRDPDREYWITSYRDGGYSARGGRGRYSHNDPSMERFDERLSRIMDSADEYQYGRDRYRDGGSEEHMMDGLEKLMYSICTFVESAMDFAETPQEKEIIRKHIQKLQNV